MAFSEKGALKEGRTIVFADQSGFYLLPMVVRTYAPVGETPILKENLTRDHLSAMSAITLEGKLYMIEQERSFEAEDAVRCLKHLMRQIAGKVHAPPIPFYMWSQRAIYCPEGLARFAARVLSGSLVLPRYSFLRLPPSWYWKYQ